VEEPKLGADSTDYAVAAAKGLAGLVPGIGGIVGELIGAVIPNQRIDRIARFLGVLNEKLKILGDEVLKAKLRHPNATVLLEDALLLAYRAQTEERLRQIAAVVVNGISPLQMQIFEARRMLALLDELVEPEVILLQAYGVSWIPIYPFFRIHRSTLSPSPSVLSDPREVRDSDAIRQSYHRHLEQLNLVDPKLEIESDSRDRQKIVRSGDGQITALGRAFLRYIDEEIERDPKSPMHALPKNE
jgi:hypothetical protein